MADDEAVSQQELADELGLPIEFLDIEEMSDEERLDRVRADVAELARSVDADQARMIELARSLASSTRDPGPKRRDPLPRRRLFSRRG